MKQTAVEWTPKNGERVWIKVFSNWSLGTYVGFDTIENKHIVREDADGGGHLMASSQVLPEDENPNVPNQPTAVEWLVNELLHLDNEFDMNLIDKNEYQKRRKQIIEQAKEIEKKQIKDAWINSLTKGDYNSAEEYYNKTFKSE